MVRNGTKRTFRHAPSEDSDQPAHSRSLIRIFTGRILESEGCKVCSCGKEDSDQTARMRRLICPRLAHISEDTFSLIAVQMSVILTIQGNKAE